MYDEQEKNKASGKKNGHKCLRLGALSSRATYLPRQVGLEQVLGLGFWGLGFWGFGV